MTDVAASSPYAKHVDSLPKLHFLLFLHRHPEISATSQEFAERLYFGHTPLLETILAELCHAGLLDQIEDCYKLGHGLEIQSFLQSLAHAFEDPLARQKVLDQIRYRSTAAQFH
ncbi:MAG: hypothetical protein KJ077_31130 [Anaerolineae bacterium]|nr:hypothetical protein [Anaerolineae bacterium]